MSPPLGRARCKPSKWQYTYTQKKLQQSQCNITAESAGKKSNFFYVVISGNITAHSRCSRPQEGRCDKQMQLPPKVIKLHNVTFMCRITGE